MSHSDVEVSSVGTRGNLGPGFKVGFKDQYVCFKLGRLPAVEYALHKVLGSHRNVSYRVGESDFVVREKDTILVISWEYYEEADDSDVYDLPAEEKGIKGFSCSVNKTQQLLEALKGNIDELRVDRRSYDYSDVVETDVGLSPGD